MKILKRILISLLVLVALLLIIPLFISKDFAVEKTITINRPSDQVFDFVKYLKNQDRYSYWAMADPNSAKDYSGTDASVGFVSKWDSKKLGSGEQEIKGIDENARRVDYELRFFKPMKATNNAYMAVDNTGAEQSKVKWGISGKMSYPMNIMSPFMDKMLGKDLD